MTVRVPVYALDEYKAGGLPPGARACVERAVGCLRFGDYESGGLPNDPSDRAARPPDEAMVRAELEVALEAAIEALDRLEQVVVRARRAGELYREIEERLGIRRAVASEIEHQAHEKLREMLAAHAG